MIQQLCEVLWEPEALPQIAMHGLQGRLFEEVEFISESKFKGSGKKNERNYCERYSLGRKERPRHGNHLSVL